MSNNAADREVLRQLVLAGSDLSKPCHTIHYLYFRSLQAAQSAAKELEAMGYENLDVHPALGQSLLSRLFRGREYACIAETTAVPSEPAVFETTETFEALAQRYGGAYDGWQAAVVR